jgi:hypothetical protein
MKFLNGRTQAAVLAGSLVFGGGVASVMADKGSPVSDNRGRQGPVDLVKEARESEGEVTMVPVAAEVKALVATGTVMSIDRDSRSVVVRDDAGEEVTVQIPADANSFDRLEVGDRIDLNVLQPLEIAPPTQ